jgi:hypothetical protein
VIRVGDAPIVAVNANILLVSLFDNGSVMLIVARVANSLVTSFASSARFSLLISQFRPENPSTHLHSILVAVRGTHNPAFLHLSQTNGSVLFPISPVGLGTSFSGEGLGGIITSSCTGDVVPLSEDDAEPVTGGTTLSIAEPDPGVTPLPDTTADPDTDPDTSHLLLTVFKSVPVGQAAEQI